MSRLQIIKSSRKLISYVLLLVLFPLSFGLLLMGVYMTLGIFDEYELIALTGGLMFLLIGVTFLFMSIFGSKRLVIDVENQSISIVFIGLFKKTFNDLSQLKYNNIPFTNQFGSYSGILIQDKSEFQYQLSEFDTRNFKDIRVAIEKIVVLDTDVSINYFKPILKPLLIACGLIIITLVASNIVT